jgi:hypothetical protein
MCDSLHSRNILIAPVVVVWMFGALPSCAGEDNEQTNSGGEFVLFNGSDSDRSALVSCDHGDRKSTNQAIGEECLALLRKAMAPPQTIQVPKDIPLHKESGGTIIFPRLAYEQRYIEGWNECLYVVGNTDADIRGEIMTPNYTSFKDDFYSGAALVQGFHDGQQLILTLANIYRLEAIRNVAKELHRKIDSNVAWRRNKIKDGRSPLSVPVQRDHITNGNNDDSNQTGCKTSK